MPGEVSLERRNRMNALHGRTIEFLPSSLKFAACDFDPAAAILSNRGGLDCVDHDVSFWFGDGRKPSVRALHVSVLGRRPMHPTEML